MINKEEFIHQYKTSYYKLIDKVYIEERKNYLKKYYRFLLEEFFLLVCSFFIIVLFLQKILTLWLFLTFSFLWLILFLFLLIMNYSLLNKQHHESCYFINAYLYEIVLSFLSQNDYLHEEKTQLAIEDFSKINLFNLHLLNYRGSNFTCSNYQGKKFLFCDSILYDLVERIKKDSYYDAYYDIYFITRYAYQKEIPLFNGLYYETTINRFNDELIYLIPRNLKDKFIRKHLHHYLIFDGKKVELENYDFAQKYQVYANDEVKSRYILSLNLMEKINMLDSIIPNKKYLVFKRDGRVGIFISDFSINKLKSKLFSLHRKMSISYVTNFYMEVEKLFKISMILEDVHKFDE